MDKVKNVPEIRFKGFNDEWKHYALEEFGKVKSCKRIYRDETSDYGDVPFYKIGTFGSKADAFIDDETYEYYKKNFAYPRNGDLLISASGSLGKVVEYMGEEAYFQDSNIVWLDLENELLQNKFLKHLYSYVSWDTVEGSTIKRLYNKDILSKKVTIPSKEEQLKIANTFELVNKKLELEKEKHEKLINFKKAMLEDMFPKEGEKVPKVRFDGFNDEWRNYKIGNLLKYEQPASYIVNSDKYKSSGTPVLTANKAFILGYTNEENVYNKGDCIIFDDFTMDIKYVDFDFKVKSSALKILTSQSHPLYYMYILLGIQNFVSKAHRRHYIGYVQKLDVLTPSLEEQVLIGNFFKNLDEKIELSEQKIAKIENFKKAMLEKMFV